MTTSTTAFFLLSELDWAEAAGKSLRPAKKYLAEEANALFLDLVKRQSR